MVAACQQTYNPSCLAWSDSWRPPDGVPALFLIDNRKKTCQMAVSPTCPYNVVNFGPLAAEICWRVWGTPAHFNGFRVLAALLHGTLVVGISQTLRH